MSAGPVTDVTERVPSQYPLIDLDLTFGSIKDCISVLDVVADLLAEDEIIDAARPAAQILEYAVADLRRYMEKAELLHGDASSELHRLCYPEQYRDGVRISQGE
jgi:hypothetical protein